MTDTPKRCDPEGETITLFGSSAIGQTAVNAAMKYTHKCTLDTIIVEFGYYIETIRSGKEDQKIRNDGKYYDSASGVGTVEQDAQLGKQGPEIGMYDGSLTDIAKNATTPAKNLTPEAIGVLIFSVVANKSLKNKVISIDYMDQLFLHGGEPGVVAVGRQGSSGSRKVLLEFFGRTEANGPPVPGICNSSIRSGSCYAQSTQDLLDFVNTTQNAIGYATIASTQTGDLTRYQHVDELPINGVPATPANVRVGSYSFVGVEHFYLQPNPSDLVKSFSQYIVNQYIPVDQTKYVIPCSGVIRILEPGC